MGSARCGRSGGGSGCGPGISSESGRAMFAEGRRGCLHLVYSPMAQGIERPLITGSVTRAEHENHLGPWVMRDEPSQDGLPAREDTVTSKLPRRVEIPPAPHGQGQQLTGLPALVDSLASQAEMRGHLVNGPSPTLSIQELLPSLEASRAGGHQDLFWIGPVYHFRRFKHPQHGLHIRTGCRRFAQPGCRHAVERLGGCRQPAGQKCLTKLVAANAEGLAHCLGERSRRALESERPRRSPTRSSRSRFTSRGSVRHWSLGHPFGKVH